VKMKLLCIATLLLISLNLTESSAKWFLAENEQGCDTVPSELRSDNPVDVCQESGSELCGCVKRAKGFVFICGYCTFKFVVNKRIFNNPQGNDTNDSPGNDLEKLDIKRYD